ncbi:MAG TPA: hypothetical protein HA362_01355 [Nanoarchaeota archaeon]|nr:hypothetical protein [Nanoarchaeota archaeon]
MSLKNKIGAGLMAAGAGLILAGGIASNEVRERANAYFTEDVKYVRMVEREPWQRHYPAVDQLYTKLKAEPGVQEAIGHYEALQDETSNLMLALGLGGVGVSLAGVGTRAWNSGRQKEGEKKKE